MKLSSPVPVIILPFLAVWFTLTCIHAVDLRNPPAKIDFDDIPIGNTIVSIGPDIKIRAFKEPLDAFTNPLLPALPIVFDSSNPGTADRQVHLGTPNESFGGPGVGEGGAGGMAYANNRPRGKLLVISANEDVMFPEANWWGGVISITFRLPTNIDSFGIIMGQSYRNNVDVITADGQKHALQFYSKEYNSYWLVPIKIPNVIQLVYKPQSISGITHINLKPELPERCPVTRVLDFANFRAGSMVSSLPGDGVTIWATRETNAERRFPAMILDTSRPGNDHIDFGAPTNAVGGPGFGAEGRLGQPFENIQKQGNALVVSADSNSARPSVARVGGTIFLTFSQPVYVVSLGLLNNVQGTNIRAMITYRNLTYFEEVTTAVGGRNSFQEVFMSTPGTRELRITFYGPGAVTFVKLGRCLP